MVGIESKILGATFLNAAINLSQANERPRTQKGHWPIRVQEHQLSV